VIRKKIIFFVLGICLTLSFINGNAEFNKSGVNSTEKNEYLKMSFNLQLPKELEVKEINIEYQVGYGKKEMSELIKKDILAIDSNTEAIEATILEAGKLDYSKYLLVIYNVNILYGTTGQILKGGGGNFINLKNYKIPIKKIVLQISYDKENDQLTFVPRFILQNQA